MPISFTIPTLQKCLEAAKRPILFLVILEVLWWGLEMMPVLSLLAGNYLYLVKYGILLWAGYQAVKQFGFDLGGAVLVGALAGIAVEIVDLILSLIFDPGYFSIGYLFDDIVRWILIAALLSGIGYFIAAYRQTSTQSDPDETKNEDV